MDALMAALVAALLTQASDRPPWLAARLGDQFGRRDGVMIAAAVAVTISSAVAGFAGHLMAPILTPNARGLLLAFALLSAGTAALWPTKPLPQPGGRTLGAFATSLITLLAATMGDRTQFLTLAIAARSDAPIFAAIGAVIGTLAVQIPAVLGGDALRRQLPVTAVRAAIGVLLTIAGVVVALSALRLI